MKIETKENQIILKEVYNSITLETKEGKQLHICMRDMGFEMKINDGKWNLITNESDFRTKQFEEIVQWQKETFGQATALSKMHHLGQEFKELIDALLDEDHLIDTSKRRATRMEFADCFILLIGAAASDGMTYDDIHKSIEEKMRINRNRKWGNPDKNGVVNHVE